MSYSFRNLSRYCYRMGRCNVVLGVLLGGILISIVSSNILNRRELTTEMAATLAQPQFQMRDIQPCQGAKRQIYLNQGQELTLETPGYKGEFQPGCEENWEISLYRDNQELSQYIIRIDILEMNIPCATSSLRIVESGTINNNVLYCDNKSNSFISHEHLLNVKFNNKDTCNESGKCTGVGAKIRISAEYVCGGKFTDNKGYIYSPDYPNNYRHSTTCFYGISAPEDLRVELTCQTFELSPYCGTRRCVQDSGDRDSLKDIMSNQRFEVHELKGKTLLSKNHHMSLYFLSNSYDLSSPEGPYGFNCSYTFIS